MGEPDSTQPMLAWLADQDPDVRHAIAAQVNWDQGVPVLAWIASRPDCDQATAASIVWLGDPQYCAGQLLEGRAPRPSEDWELLQQVLRRFRDGAYSRSELAPFRGVEGSPERYLAALGGRPDPLELPRSLFERATGRPPQVPEACDPKRSAHVWDLLAALGTFAGRRPSPAP